jgi:hypothetical protein
MLEEADLVLVMSPRHVVPLCKLVGDLLGKVYTLPEYAIGVSGAEGTRTPMGTP